MQDKPIDKCTRRVRKFGKIEKGTTYFITLPASCKKLFEEGSKMVITVYPKPVKIVIEELK